MKMNKYELYVKDDKCPYCHKGKMIWLGPAYKYKCDNCYKIIYINVDPAVVVE